MNSGVNIIFWQEDGRSLIPGSLGPSVRVTRYSWLPKMGHVFPECILEILQPKFYGKFFYVTMGETRKFFYVIMGETLTHFWLPYRRAQKRFWSRPRGSQSRFSVLTVYAVSVAIRLS